MNKFMELAIKEAQEGITKGHGGPFGAVIVKDGEVIASGHNHVVANNDPTCHGEIDAIRKACQKLGTFDLSGCELWSSAEPCEMCMCAIAWANINKVYYGCTIEDNEMIGFRDNIFNKGLSEIRKNICEQIDRDSCIELFNQYNNIKDKTNY